MISRYRFNRYKQSAGFSLLEMAIVLMIIGALLGAILKPFGAQLIQRQRSQTGALLIQVRDAVIGFAAANSHLPCPLLVSSQPQGDCSVGHGYVPAAVLGIDGAFDDEGLLVDAWGQPLRYSVSLSDADNNGSADFMQVRGMQEVGMQSLTPDLEVCESAAACRQLRANQIPVVIVSTGASAAARSVDEKENTDGDRRFVKRDHDQAGADQFDDLLVWVSENALYTHLIQARVLP